MISTGTVCPPVNQINWIKSCRRSFRVSRIWTALRCHPGSWLAILKSHIIALELDSVQRPQFWNPTLSHLSSTVFRGHNFEIWHYHTWARQFSEATILKSHIITLELDSFSEATIWKSHIITLELDSFQSPRFWNPTLSHLSSTVFRGHNFEIPHYHTWAQQFSEATILKSHIITLELNSFQKPRCHKKFPFVTGDTYMRQLFYCL